MFPNISAVPYNDAKGAIHCFLDSDDRHMSTQVPAFFGHYFQANLTTMSISYVTCKFTQWITIVTPDQKLTCCTHYSTSEPTYVGFIPQCRNTVWVQSVGYFRLYWLCYCRLWSSKTGPAMQCQYTHSYFINRQTRSGCFSHAHESRVYFCECWVESPVPSREKKNPKQNSISASRGKQTDFEWQTNSLATG